MRGKKEKSNLIYRGGILAPDLVVVRHVLYHFAHLECLVSKMLIILNKKTLIFKRSLVVLKLIGRSVIRLHLP